MNICEVLAKFKETEFMCFRKRVNPLYGSVKVKKDYKKKSCNCGPSTVVSFLSILVAVLAFILSVIVFTSVDKYGKFCLILLSDARSLSSSLMWSQSVDHFIVVWRTQRQFNEQILVVAVGGW
jgi:hypothetical protein